MLKWHRAKGMLLLLGGHVLLVSLCAVITLEDITKKIFKPFGERMGLL